MGTERIKNRYNIVCVCGDTVQVVTIQEVDMDGWILFECYLQWPGQVVYFSQEDCEEPLEYIDMQGDDVPPEWIDPLVHAIRERKAA